MEFVPKSNLLYTHMHNTHLLQCMHLRTQALLHILSKYCFSERQTNPTRTFYPPTLLFFHSGVSFHGHICQPVTFNLSLLLFLIMASHCVLSPSLDTQWWKDIFSHVAKMSLGKHPDPALKETSSDMKLKTVRTFTSWWITCTYCMSIMSSSPSFLKWDISLVFDLFLF